MAYQTSRLSLQRRAQSSDVFCMNLQGLREVATAAAIDEGRWRGGVRCGRRDGLGCRYAGAVGSSGLEPRPPAR